MATVPVPVLVGLTRDAAVTKLSGVGLIEGDETKVLSAAPVNSVTRSIPAAGTMVGAGAKVDIDVSAGVRSRWWETTTSFIFSVFGIITLLALLTVLAVSIFTDKGPLQELSKFEVARGLITFLIAFTTVGIAIILAISTVVLQDSPENDKRFDRGKQVLTVLIGVLGTIVGFYFSSAQSTNRVSSLAITSPSLPNGTVGGKYPDTQLVTNNVDSAPPLKWSVKPSLPSGLSLSESGVISGTPSEESQDKAFTFTVIDATSKTATKTLNLSIAPPSKQQQEKSP